MPQDDKQDCPALHSDVLKVGHHGSPSSSGEDFLAFVRAKQAIISVGPNHYGHPSRRVLKHLERSGAEILRTDWLTVRADPDILYDTPIEERFSAAMQLLGIDPGLLSTEAGHA